MAPRRNPLRSSRSTKAAHSTLDSEWFYDIKDSESPIHQKVNALNLEAYPSEMFFKADDLLMFMAFAQKGKKRRHHSVLPEPAQSGSNPTRLSNEEGILGAKICEKQFNGSEPSWKAVVQSVEALQQQIPAFRSDAAHWSACLRQYVHYLLLPIVCLIFNKFAL